MFRALMRRHVMCSKLLATVALRGAATSTPADESRCVLCDVEFESWADHSSEATHRARHAVCGASINPAKHEALMRQLWEHIQVDFALIDEVNEQKVRRRQTRLRATLEHLMQEGAINHAVAKLAENNDGNDKRAVVISDQLSKYVVIGEREVRYHVVDRVTRLYPTMLAADVRAVVAHVMSQRNLAAMFDGVGVSALPARSATELDDDAKAAILLGMIGELQCFSTREKAFHVTNNNVARDIVQTVLATHAMENVVSELVHEVLQAIVDEGSPVWVDYVKSLQAIQSSGVPRPPPMALAASPSPAPAASATTDGTSADDRKSADLAELIKIVASLHASQGIYGGGITASHAELVRAGTLDITVPNPVNKAAFFAPMAPKLAQKGKK